MLLAMESLVSDDQDSIVYIIINLICVRTDLCILFFVYIFVRIYYFF